MKKKIYLSTGLLALLIVVGPTFVEIMDEKSIKAVETSKNHIVEKKKFFELENGSQYEKKETKIIENFQKKKTGNEVKKIKKESIFPYLDFLNGKVLFSDTELEIKKSFLSDHKNIRKAYKTLTNISKGAIRENIKSRFDSITYLHESLKLKDNPAREEVLKRVKYFILTSLDGIELSKTEKKFIIGDKVELISTLSRYAPEYLSLIKKNYSNQKLQKLISFVENHYSNGEKDERKN